MVVKEDKYIKTERIINSSGEIVKEKISEYYNPYVEDKGYNFKYSADKTKIYKNVLFPKDIEIIDRGRLHLLSEYIYGDTNKLLYRSTENKYVPYTKKDIQDILGLHRNTFNRFWKKVLRDDIIKINSKNEYCFNPLYFNSTTYMGAELYFMFKESLNKHIPKHIQDKFEEQTNTLHNSNKIKEI